ncbi:MAG: MaoC family dehydratase [Bacteroidales bacterium]|jgi:acyl dehydratase|nr:MaoC family dehydratase [Bacteroidales bacterium]
MEKIVINSHDELAAFEGKEIGVSPYFKITQDQINQFAEATIDHQWIHTDPARAERETPFKKTIAHGYLTVSLLPYMWDQLVDIRNVKMMVNYGIEKLKFGEPVLVDSSVRIRVKLKSIQNLRGITKAQMTVKMEVDGKKKSAYDADIVFLYHFN